jgi:hypothetical protein
MWLILQFMTMETFDEIRIELARELKNSAEEREKALLKLFQNLHQNTKNIVKF